MYDYDDDGIGWFGVIAGVVVAALIGLFIWALVSPPHHDYYCTPGFWDACVKTKHNVPPQKLDDGCITNGESVVCPPYEKR